MADNKIITDEILKKATENILQLMTDNSYKFVPYTQEEIQEVFDLDEVTAQSLSKVINDEFVAKNKVYSNEYTNTLLEKVKAECNQYTVEQIANSGNLKRKIVTSTTDVTDESILYLILTDSTNNIYTQYMLIDGTATPLGTTQVDLSDYLLTSDFNTTIADYAKKNETVAQNDVVADLTTLSSSTVLSTQGVSDELDKKVDKTSIVTSINSTSTNDEVASAKALFDNIKPINDKLGDIRFIPFPWTRHFKIKFATTSKALCSIFCSNGSIITIQTASSKAIIDTSIKILGRADRYFTYEINELEVELNNVSSNVCGFMIISNDQNATVELSMDNIPLSNKIPMIIDSLDINNTPVTLPSTMGGSINYKVKNGICYVSAWGVSATVTGDIIVSTSMPKCAISSAVDIYNHSSDSICGMLFIEETTTNLVFRCTNINNGGFISFSYPVAES